jgi:hypothetical protein
MIESDNDMNCGSPSFRHPNIDYLDAPTVSTDANAVLRRFSYGFTSNSRGRTWSNSIMK